MNKVALASIGIDYGTKRVGVAISPPDTTMAFPECVVANNKDLIPTIINLINDNNIQAVVVGHSLKLDGSDNTLMIEINKFINSLQRGLPDININLEPEHFTSFEAERYLGKNKMVDASAATIILQSWLDRKN